MIPQHEQPGPDLPLRQPHARPQEHPRPLRRRPQRTHALDQSGGPARRHNRVRRACQRSALKKVESYADLANRKVAKFVCGGTRVPKDKLPDRCKEGYFFSPTLDHQRPHGLPHPPRRSLRPHRHRRVIRQPKPTPSSAPTPPPTASPPPSSPATSPARTASPPSSTPASSGSIAG